MNKRIRVGFIGCGEVTQLLHLPTLRELPDLFEVTAFHDVSAKALNGTATAWPEASRHSALESLVADKQVDAVVIANPDAWHADAALMAMRGGKHVLIEKPVCVTRDEAEALLTAEGECGVIVQVGYMRRHAPAFIEAVQALRDRSEPTTLARVCDIIGPNASYVDSTSRIVARADDIAKDVRDAGLRKLARAHQSEIGVDSGPLARAYGLMLGLASHDTSAMRELIGAPSGVLYAKQHHGGRWITAAFDYGEFVCHLEVGLDQITRMDAKIEVFQPSRVLRVEFDSPYIRHQAAKLVTTRTVPPFGVSTGTSFPTRNDAFAAEWRAFHEHIVQGTPPKCSIADATEDLKLFREMIALMR
ncbi:gfo/Idh/MocA family oxidoreductase [Verminephrobacter aporrectodeae subsp. tuberculatae]|uniref:Gfo/Idh/MocA family oxidoreductase n=1 Tax=Verminephrobacter aporrectodeae subsp. tuberculatae TaxID=1110392 RepID=A0ABT3KNM7_9BURK|nr:Gfo/Idh/MocA family oxidoreductase [Verminephrobacter aporrectodeae]MCW5221271.1 gfo/Idh/MocA family oxidoreductase [Verminephrobacter aporrectodeae subsp. tuberculatae]MCW5290562.1 gfo/Idh/MocA family oxidoreductase [Verminephrobacter aporrectodeae subsp. tuberculatae]MCW5319870.1 gfo/Idh/MocA family oxidoreductase [Verminephrobacter aporrectodeae subsp. tuberculatae]MCW8200356.1 gfo/Idh/MocA family oxidoreductase [Verminephrobacter aporrectodeae subsp. tuberculatae]